VSASDELFAAQRPRLIGLAYRLLGSVVDAEDVVQEAWVRWNGVDHDELVSPGAWLTTVVSRLGIDRLRARQRDQTSYVGPWLPEPLISGGISRDDDPAAAAELSDSLTTAFLVLLERLSPNERLVLLLADVFQQPFAAVAEVIGKSEEATRQLAVRARRKVRTTEEAAARRPPGRAEQLAIAQDFVTAVVSGDERRVRDLLTSDSVLTSDGGANRHAARRPVVGPQRIARFLINLARRFGAITDHSVNVEPTWINGAPGLIVAIDGNPYWVAALDVRDGKVDRFFVMVNPDKLASLDHRIDLV